MPGGQRHGTGGPAEGSGTGLAGAPLGGAAHGSTTGNGGTGRAGGASSSGLPARVLTDHRHATKRPAIRARLIEEEGYGEVYPKKKVSVKGGGVVFVGPIPIVFGSNWKIALVLMLIALGIILVMVFFVGVF